MPTIRDGRGVLTEYDMGTPPANPSGPVQRVVEPSVVARQQAAPKHDFMAASRARGAKAGGFVKGATKAARAWNGQKAPEAGGGPGKPPSQTGAKRTPEQREHMRLAMIASYERRRGGAAVAEPVVDRASLTNAEHRRAQKAAHVMTTPPTIEAQGPEAGVPATDATVVEQPERDGSAVESTPPGPTEPAPGIVEEYPEPDSTRRVDVVLPCEGCIHAAVCAIKPVLEAWADRLGFGPPSPDPALSVAAISFACVHELQGAP